MKRKELIELCEKAKKHASVALSGKSDYCIMVLELMDTREYDCNYCKSLEAVLSAFPEICKETLERELDKYL